MTTTHAVPRGEVPEAFDEVADRYDLMVALNPGYHAHLRASATALVESLPAGDGPVRLLDLGCGSGASTKALVAALEESGRDYTLVGVDASAGMLREARKKDWPSGVTFAQGRAEGVGRPARARRRSSPTAGSTGSSPPTWCATCPSATPCSPRCTRCCAPVRRSSSTSTPSPATGRPRRSGPPSAGRSSCPLGYVTSRRTRLYQYLWKSVMEMDSTQRLMDRMLGAGFEDVRSRTMGSWQRGIIHTFHARRPLDS